VKGVTDGIRRRIVSFVLGITPQIRWLGLNPIVQSVIKIMIWMNAFLLKAFAVILSMNTALKNGESTITVVTYVGVNIHH
jgi:hypothetical protein